MGRRLDRADQNGHHPAPPSKTVEVDGQRVDVVASGDFVEKGEKVKIIEANGTRTVVKRL